jgi:small-conductance mechanosensitive channel
VAWQQLINLRTMQKKVVKSGAYLTLIIGLVIALSLFVCAIVFLMNYTASNLTNKILFTGVLFFTGLVIAYLSIATFQSMTGVVEAQEEIEELEEKIEDLK